jgi:hypothetical protein
MRDHDGPMDLGGGAGPSSCSGSMYFRAQFSVVALLGAPSARPLLMHKPASSYDSG